MPKHAGSSNKAREANIKEEIASGKPIKQAVAIGYSEQRQARKHEGKAMSKHSGHKGGDKHGALSMPESNGGTAGLKKAINGHEGHGSSPKHDMVGRGGEKSRNNPTHPKYPG